MANFGSDNAAGVHPKILESFARASVGSASAYGEDALSKSVDKRFSDLFECDLLSKDYCYYHGTYIFRGTKNPLVCTLTNYREQVH